MKMIKKTSCTHHLVPFHSRAKNNKHNQIRCKKKRKNLEMQIHFWGSSALEDLHKSLHLPPVSAPAEVSFFPILTQTSPPYWKRRQKDKKKKTKIICKSHSPGAFKKINKTIPSFNLVFPYFELAGSSPALGICGGWRATTARTWRQSLTRSENKQKKDT